MARICAVCGRRADSMLYMANKIGNSVLCADCYAKIPDYKPDEKFVSAEAVDEKKKKVLDEAEQNAFPVNVCEDIRHFYEEEKQALQANALMAAAHKNTGWITTTPSFAGYRITSYKGIASGESVLGTGLFSGLDASLADWTGTESGAYQAKIDQAEEKALERAMQDALKLGGNAIVGAKMDLEMMTDDIICVLVTGTAVTIEKEA